MMAFIRFLILYPLLTAAVREFLSMGRVQGQSSVHAFEGKVPVWLWWDYKGKDKYPAIVELSRRALEKFGPSSDFEIHHVNADNIKDFLEDWPEEMNLKKIYVQAISDVARAGLLAKYGGIYMDSDILVTSPLREITDLLEGPDGVDMVSYTSDGQSCEDGSFSSNFMAAKPGSLLHQQWWADILERIRTSCTDADWEKTQVCCKQPDGNPHKKCHVSWGGAGERIAHPLLKSLLLKEGNTFKVHCFNERDGEGFAPCVDCMWNDLLDNGEELHEKSCNEEDNQLKCNNALVKNFFNRRAYHLFSSNAPKKASEAKVEELSQNGSVMATLISRKLADIKLDKEDNETPAS